ncbi:hypothetical protein ONZ45_g9203 [Pleurotus djamor]|nr:hypothetical protein ONZ45_g9203 [Pleurotus djamor]
MASTATAASLPSYMMPGVPVVQPPHLDGDSSLATEVLPGPPSIASVQQAALKGAVKKPVSYLPPKDPNSTYAALLAITPQASLPQVEGPRTKRMRTDRPSTSGRAQRASARQNGQNAVLSAPPNPPAPDDSISISAQQPTSSDAAASVLEGTSSAISISAPAQASTSKPTNGRGRPRRDKGKGKDVDGLAVKVKEEPKTDMLPTPEPVGPVINHNDDHCSACRSYGGLVYCDGCPKSFHFWCLNPPVEEMDDKSWFCRACMAKKTKPPKPEPSELSSLISHLDYSNPVEFQLPEDIRTFFKDVGTAPNGAYVDTSEAKQPRLKPSPPDNASFQQEVDVSESRGTHYNIKGSGQFNNGNIDVIDSDTISSAPPKVPVDEVLINGRRYRVPEKTIIMDFWERCQGVHPYPSAPAEEDSGSLTPLTTLSSLEEDMAYQAPLNDGSPSHTPDDLQVAKLEMLASLRGSTSSKALRSPVKLNGIVKHSKMVDAGTQTEGDPHVKAHLHPTLVDKPTPTRGARRIVGPPAKESQSRVGSSTSISLRRRKSTNSVQPEPSTRELRSRTTREGTASSVATTTKAETAPRKSTGKGMTATDYLIQAGVVAPRDMKPPDSIPPLRIKAVGRFRHFPSSQSIISAPPKPKRGRARKLPQKDPEPPKEATEVKEKRPRKRKVREDDVEADLAPPAQIASTSSGGKARPPVGGKTIMSAPVPVKRAARGGKRGGAASTRSPATPRRVTEPAPPVVTTTPTLKIRLPKPSNLSASPQRPGLSVDTPTSL